MHTFAKSEDLDEMQHNAACHLGQLCLWKVKMIFRQKNKMSFENYNLTPLDMYNGLSQVYYIKSEDYYIKSKGKIH